MRAMRFGAKSVPIAFALITITAYGLLLPLMGFYWDDWPFAWIARFQGPGEFIPAFTGFRPFLGPIFFLTTSVLPSIPWVWQVTALVVRFFAGMAAWFAARQVWPRAARLPLAAAVLFLVFPGYSQQWVALTHINQEWISLIAYLLSLGLSTRAVRQPTKHRWDRAAALMLLLVALLPTEYFLGLEVLRPVFFWIALQGNTTGRRASALAVIKGWLPFVVVWLINAAWLLYYYRSGLYISYGLEVPAHAPSIFQTLSALGDALWKAGLYVWLQVVPLVIKVLPGPTGLLTLGLVAMSFALLLLYLMRLELPPPVGADEGTKRDNRDGHAEEELNLGDARWAILAGAIGILAGRIPSLAAGLPLTLQSSFDRLTISMMPGAALFVAGILQLLFRRHVTVRVALAGVVALAIGQQFLNANVFRRDWARQNEIYWQFAWRVPSLRPGTAILTQQMPLDYETDLSMTAALNWIYAETIEPPELPYAVIYTEKRLGGNALPELRAGVPIRLPFRTLEFHGSTSGVIVVYVPTDGCLRVLDPALGDVETYSVLPEAATAATPLSDTSLILTDAGARRPANPPFSPEADHGWCYFFERAELARQGQDWGRIIDLRAQADEAGQSPYDYIEWLPFIEAEARSGDLAWALQATRTAISEEPKLRRGLCVTWERVHATEHGDAASRAAEVLSELSCER